MTTDIVPLEESRDEEDSRETLNRVDALARLEPLAKRLLEKVERLHENLSDGMLDWRGLLRRAKASRGH